VEGQSEALPDIWRFFGIVSLLRAIALVRLAIETPDKRLSQAVHRADSSKAAVL